MQFIKGGFSYRAKKEMGLNFEIWQKGYNEHRIRNAEEYAQHVEYVWMNPVKAGLVERPEEFPYSSAQLKAEVDPAPLQFQLSLAVPPSKSQGQSPMDASAVLSQR